MRRSLRVAGVCGAVLLAATVGVAPTLHGQTNRLTVLTLSGFPLTVSTTTPADFDAGSVPLGTTGFTVDLTSNAGPGFATRVTTVNVQCGLPCPAGVTSLQWRRNDLSVWNTLTTSFALVESRTATFNGVNDPWSNSMLWRYLVGWTTNPPAPTEQYLITFQLVVTAP
ncbi:MAG: hypothetical protein WD771_07945 [Gemmatimonadaceae bacterium]